MLRLPGQVFTCQFGIGKELKNYAEVTTLIKLVNLLHGIEDNGI